MHFFRFWSQLLKITHLKKVTVDLHVPTIWKTTCILVSSLYNPKLVVQELCMSDLSFCIYNRRIWAGLHIILWMQALAKHWKVLLWQIISPFRLFYMLNLPLGIPLGWTECALSINTPVHLPQLSRHVVPLSLHSKVGKSTSYMRVMETAMYKTEEA